MDRQVEGAAAAQLRLGRNVRVARAECGLTQDRIAADTGLQRTHISAIELGKLNPSVVTLLRLARALGVTAESLLRGVAL